MLAILTYVRWHLILVFICIPLISDVEHSLCACWSSIYLLWKMSIQVLSPFFIRLFDFFFFFWCWVVWVLYIYRILTPIKYVFCKYLPPFNSSVQLSCSVRSNCLLSHESQNAKPPCPSPNPEFTQTHVHWVSDAIQPSHPLLSLSPPALNLSQHQGLFRWVSSSY